MKLTTVTIPAIEMTQAESNALWEAFCNRHNGPAPSIEGKRVDAWNTLDGNNEILLEGETAFRKIVITGEL